MATLYVLCGLPGTGKTTWAKRVEAAEGALLLSPDAVVFAEFRARRGLTDGRDLSATDDDPVFRAGIEAGFLRQAEEVLATGRSVILDFGFWHRDERDETRRLAERAGAIWRLIAFELDPDTQWARIARRNEGDLTDTRPILPEELDGWAAMFERPDGEGEEVVDTGTGAM